MIEELKAVRRELLIGREEIVAMGLLKLFQKDWMELLEGWWQHEYRSKGETR